LFEPKGWDSTFRVANWKVALGEWMAVNAMLPSLDLEKISELPVLDVRGTHDRVISPYDGLDTQGETKAEVAFVSKAGHLPWAEQPEDFMFVVREFLDKVLSSHNVNFGDEGNVKHDKL
jgi:pimeloyl-ACP methyl ester carboxylesterase